MKTTQPRKRKLQTLRHDDRTALERLDHVEAELTELQGLMFNLLGYAMAQAYKDD